MITAPREKRQSKQVERIFHLFEFLQGRPKTWFTYKQLHDYQSLHFDVNLRTTRRDIGQLVNLGFVDTRQVHTDQCGRIWQVRLFANSQTRLLLEVLSLFESKHNWFMNDHGQYIWDVEKTPWEICRKAAEAVDPTHELEPSPSHRVSLFS